MLASAVFILLYVSQNTNTQDGYYFLLLLLLLLFFNRNLNRGCLVYIFSLLFSGSKFVINLQFRVCKIFFVYVKFFVHKVLRDSQSFHFASKIAISKMCTLYAAGCSFIKVCSLTSQWGSI